MISSCRLEGSSSCGAASWALGWAGLRVGPTGGDRDREDSVLWCELFDMRLAWDGEMDMAKATGSNCSSGTGLMAPTGA